jgi:hypothetical protein
MPYTVPANAQGSTFTFDGDEYRVVSVKFDQKGGEDDITDMSVPAGQYRKYASKPIKDGAEVSIEFWGTTTPTVLTTGTIAFTKTGGGEALSGLSGTAICTSISLDAKVGELIKGTASFRLTYES